MDVNEGTQWKPRWEVELTGAAEAKIVSHEYKAEQHLDVDKKLVFKALEKLPDGEVSTRLRESTGLNSDRFPQRLTRWLKMA